MKAVIKNKLSVLVLWLLCLDTAAQNVGINQLNPEFPLDIMAGQGVIRVITTDSSNGSVLELRNIETASENLGSINFNDSIGYHPGQISYKTNHNLTFRTGYVEHMRIDPFGRVGIGTTTPQWPIDISAYQGVVGITTTSANYGSGVELRNLNPAAEYLGALNFNDSIGSYPGQIAYLSNHNLTFRTSQLERMRIDPYGHVGIGTLTPQWPIDIRAYQGVVGITTTNANYGSGVELRNLNPAAEYLGALNFNDSIGSYPGQIAYFSNHNLTFRTNLIERMRIDPLGRLGLGTQSPFYKIDVVDNDAIARFRSNSVDGSGIILRNMATTSDLLGYVEFQGPSGQPGSWMGGLPNLDLLFVVNNSECLRIRPNGNIGFGISAPVSPVHIRKPQAVVRLDSYNASSGSIIDLRNISPGNLPVYLGAINFNDSIGSAPGQVAYLANHNLAFRTNGIERMRIDQLGRVGVGTLTPQWPIDVTANQSVIRLNTTTATYGSGVELRNLKTNAFHLGAINFNDSIGSYPGQIAYESNHNLTFRINYLERMRIDPLGRVGIGTNYPQVPIDVLANQSLIRLTSATASNGSGVELRNLNTEGQLLGQIVFSNAAGISAGRIAYQTDDNLTFNIQNQEQMRINADGRVGLGMLLPEKTIDIQKPVGNIRINSTASDEGSELELRSSNSGTQYLGSIFFNNSGNNYPGRIAYHTNHILAFTVQNQERMRIDPDGRLGIGRIPTDNILEVEGDCYIQSSIGIGTINPQWPIDMEAAQSVARLTTTSSIYGSGLELRNNVINPDYLGAINFNNSSGSYPGQIGYLGNDNMTFRVNGLERVRINSSGLTGIGRIPNTNRLEVEGNASKSTAGDWLANSDSRLKKNIKPLHSEEMLGKLLSLQGVSYEWNDDKTGTLRPEGEHYGFIAQDIQEVFPTLVEEDNLGYLQTAYGTYDPMIVESIRALDEKIRILQDENELLKNQVHDLMTMLSADKSETVRAER
jgi:hypothetical protein